MSHVRMRCTLGCQWVRPSLPCTASAHNTFFTYIVHSTRSDPKTKFLQEDKKLRVAREVSSSKKVQKREQRILREQ
jgi:hypothetical protein